MKTLLHAFTVKLFNTKNHQNLEANPPTTHILRQSLFEKHEKTGRTIRITKIFRHHESLIDQSLKLLKIMV
jgi:hypothetical protein